MEKMQLALALTKRYAREYESYLEERDEYYREGYRPQHCEHGTNLWVEYDAMCPGCEDGYTMSDGIQRRQRALDEANRRFERIDAIVNLMVETNRLLGSDAMPVEAARKAIDALQRV